jgi:hypothetical protein
LWGDVGGWKGPVAALHAVFGTSFAGLTSRTRPPFSALDHGCRWFLGLADERRLVLARDFGGQPVAAVPELAPTS